MQPVLYVVGHRNPDADSICSAIAYAALKNRLGDARVRAARAGEMDAETRSILERFETEPPPLLVDATGRDLVLVDHNEVGQAVANIDEANVVEVWEHHRIGDLRFSDPIFFHCEPVGATATLVAERYFFYGLVPSPHMAGLLLGAILSDTVAFRSPTTSDQDRRAAEHLAWRAGVETVAFGDALLRIRAEAIDAMSVTDLVRNDFKEFRFDSQRIGIAQVHVADGAALARRRGELLRSLRVEKEMRGLVLAVLMITDMQSRASDLWAVGERRDAFEAAFGPHPDGVAHLDGVMSRKKQVVPPLARAFEKRPRVDRSRERDADVRFASR